MARGSELTRVSCLFGGRKSIPGNLGRILNAIRWQEPLLGVRVDWSHRGKLENSKTLFSSLALIENHQTGYEKERSKRHQREH